MKAAHEGQDRGEIKKSWISRSADGEDRVEITQYQDGAIIVRNCETGREREVDTIMEHLGVRLLGVLDRLYHSK